MVPSISSSATTPAVTSGGPSAASLQAQLQRYQQQLSDCVNCASAKTPEGKKAIQELAAKVSQVTQKLGALQNSAATNATAAGSKVAEGAAKAGRHGQPGGTIDVFA